MNEPPLAALAARASTLDERLAGHVVADPAESDDVRTAARLDHWRLAAADGDDQAFLRRLEWDGLSVAEVRPLLGTVRWPAGVPLPPWVDIVRDAANVASSAPEDVSDPVIDRDRPRPFEQVVLPFVDVARSRLGRRGTDMAGLLEPAARTQLERDLLERLAHLSGPALHLEFSVRQATRSSGLARLLARAEDPGSRAGYDAFVTDTRRDLLGFFLGYPVLARLLARTVDQWIDAARELLDRLSRDHTDLARAFSDGAPLGAVVGIEPGLSDPHHHGRTVMALRFASGTEVMYKPKDLGTEEMFGELLGWLDRRNFPLPLRAPRVLTRPGYGWAERIPHLPCRDADEATRFYRRAGMLLALVHVLAGTDCHRGNLVAAGEHPVLLDAECLLHPRARPVREPEGATGIAEGELQESVLGTGLLPRWEIEHLAGGGQRATDISGLHTVEPAELVVQARRWQFLNTDHLAYEQVDVPLPVPTSQPRLDRAWLRLEDHAGDVLDGLAQGYRFLAAHQTELLAAEGPVQALRSADRALRASQHEHVRVAARPAARPCLPARRRRPQHRAGPPRTDGRRRCRGRRPSLHLAAGRRGTGADGAARRADPPGPARRGRRPAARWRQRRRVPPRTEPGGGHRSAPGAQRVRPREPAGTRRRRALRALGAGRRVRVRGAATATRGRAPALDDGRRAGADLEEAAARAAARIAGTAITAADGSVTWIAPQYLPGVDRYQLQPVSWDLNTGTCGIALFLAAVDNLSEAPVYRDLALKAVQPLRQALHEDAAGVAQELGTGGATGIGSVVYALTRMSPWLEEPELLDDARLAAVALSDELVDGPVDVFVGAAGAVLGLLGLHQARPDPAVLERAVACGDRVLRGRVPGESGHRAWPTVEGGC